MMVHCQRVALGSLAGCHHVGEPPTLHVVRMGLGVFRLPWGAMDKQAGCGVGALAKGSLKTLL